jgi:D-beta-D-heptose 7-phosphate kinase/D-beta-D-heptose 1-phosphate adenosyltransferase
MDNQQQKKLNVLLIGDNCLDVYQFGYVDRISPEAPVPVFVLTDKQEKPGMARNVALNLEAYGIDVSYLHGETSVKTRLIDSRSKQQIVRIDNDVTSAPISFETGIPTIYDAIVVSDYNKGTVSYELIEELIATGIPVFVDTKKTDIGRFNGAFVKINELEYSKRTSINDKLIVTLGSKGTLYKGRIYEADTVEVVDVCGAGDSFLSALVYGYLKTNQIERAIPFANRAAGISVQHMGVYVLTTQDVNSISYILD